VFHSYPARWLCFLVLSSSLLACAPQQKAPAPDPTALLQSVPAADPAKYEHIADMRKWRNPYMILRADGVAYFDTADSAEIHLKPGEILAMLARLPASAWPYGRVVAISENAVKGTEQDAVAMRRMKGIVGGILEGAHVTVDWVPSA
jgi:hypothetical protein